MWSLGVMRRRIEQAIVLLRLITLGIIFREFCELARGEPHEAAITDWADSLEMNLRKTRILS